MTCALPRCRQDTDVLYYSQPICHGHWLQHCDGTLDLKTVLKVPPDD